MKRGRGWKMTVEEGLNERRGWILLEKRSEATMAGTGVRLPSPRSKSRFHRQTFSTGQRFALFRFLPFFIVFFSFFLSFFSHRRIAKIPLTYNFVSRSPLCRFSRRILYKGSSRQFAKLLLFNAKLINGNFVKLWNCGVEKGVVYDLRMRLLFLIWNYFGAPIL